MTEPIPPPEFYTEKQLQAKKLQRTFEPMTKAAKGAVNFGKGVIKGLTPSQKREREEARRRRRTSKPEATGKVISGVVYGLGKEAWRGLEYLGKEGQKSKVQGPVPDMRIDLGFGTPKKHSRPRGSGPSSSGLGPRLNADQRAHKEKLRVIFKPKKSTLTPKQRRKVRIVKETPKRRHG